MIEPEIEHLDYGLIVHHIDGDRTNNADENILLVEGHWHYGPSYWERRPDR